MLSDTQIKALQDFAVMAEQVAALAARRGTDWRQNPYYTKWKHIAADAECALDTGCPASLESVCQFAAEELPDEDWSDLARPAESYIPARAA